MRVREQQDSQQVIAMQSYSGEGFYERLGVRPVINAWSWVTVAGGSIMPAPVLRAMEEASRNFVDLHDLNRKAGEVIARLTGAEAGLVSAGSGAGMLLQAAACMTGADPAKVWRLPDTRGMKNRIIMHRSHRVSYDRNFRTAGAKLVEIGDMGVTEPWQLEDAITRRTAAVAYVFGPRKSGALSLETVVEIAHSRGVPVIVDAAAMLPPAENLTKFIRVGADMVSFSGGKGVMGPQSSGILCGRKDLIEAAYMNAAPNSQGIGRPAKVSKENIAGLVTAPRTLRRYRPPGCRGIMARQVRVRGRRAPGHRRRQGRACRGKARARGLQVRPRQGRDLPRGGTAGPVGGRGDRAAPRGRSVHPTGPRWARGRHRRRPRQPPQRRRGDRRPPPPRSSDRKLGQR